MLKISFIKMFALIVCVCGGGGGGGGGGHVSPCPLHRLLRPCTPRMLHVQRSVKNLSVTVICFTYIDLLHLKLQFSNNFLSNFPKICINKGENVFDFLRLF